MSERSDYYKPTKGKFGERSRGDDGGEWSKDRTESWDPKSKRAAWDKGPTTTSAPPPPPPSSEDFPALPRKDKQSQEDGIHSEENEGTTELPPKVPDASSSSSSYTKKKKWRVTDQRSLTEMELHNLLKEYVKTCAFDSYGAVSFCSGEPENKLLEYKYFSRAVYALNLPAACPVRPEEDSKEEVAVMAYRVVKTLLDDGRIGPTEGGGWGFKKFQPTPSYALDGFPIDGHGGKLMLPILQDTRANRFRSNKVNLITIEHDKEKAWGIVVASPFEHSYQLTLDGIKFRLKAIPWYKVEQADWSLKENLEIVEQFHRRIIGEHEEEPELMLVKVKAEKNDETYEIDFESMKDLESDDVISRVRGPFKSLLAKLGRLVWWELVRLFSPAEPAPSPLKLHKIFDEPSSKAEEQEFQNDIECMKTCGMDSLRLAAALCESVDEREKSNPDLSAEYLDKKVQDNYLNPDLSALLMASSGFIRMGDRKNVGKQDAADMFFALFGAYKMESDMFAVVQLWDYLITDPDDPNGPPRPPALKRLGRANEFTAAVPKYLGRTNSYIEFGEVYQHQLPWVGPDAEPGDAKALRVRYEESSDAFYRWNGSQAEECRPGTPGFEDWIPMTYDPVHGCFCSPSMKLPNGDPRPLPNKICAWVRGRTMKKLVSVKHSMETTPPYKYLREHLDEETREVWLIVDYKHHGEVRYKRDCHGGLGEEVYEGQGHLLSYSENKKTLVSGVAIGQALPRKVVTWLLENRNLSDLIPGRKRQSVDLTYHQTGVVFSSAKDNKAVRIQAKDIEKSSKPFGHCGCFFEALVEGDEKPKVVSYSEDKKEWVYNPGSGNEEVIPWEAISTIADKTASAEAGPRLTTPTSVRKFFPKASGTAVARIEQQTDHRFLNVKLLAEALTHCSAVNAAVQPCDQLAYVGMAALESFASENVMKAEPGRKGSSGWLGDVTFFNSHLVCNEGPVNHASFCAPKEGLDWDLLVSETKCQPEDDQPGSVQAMRARLWACCNHVCYAASCIKSDLQKNINMSSTELQEHIERVCRKYPKDKETPHRWSQLFKLGAPKALGDVFLATIGAISLDSDHNEAKQLMKKHFQDSVEVYLAMGGNKAESLKHTILPNRQLAITSSATIKEALRQRQKLNQQSLALVPALKLNEEGDLPEFTLQCKDLQIVEGEFGKIACSSPRSLCISLILQGKHQDADESDENSESVADEEQDQKKDGPEQDGAIYCKPCQMWLNGPTQWADHEIGKKHRKAVHRMQAQKLVEEEENKKTALLEKVEKVPEDKKKEKDTEHESIYCKYCEMWLNGPTQWADHEMGKKHLKNVAIFEGDSTSAPKGGKAAAYDEEPGDRAGHTEPESSKASELLQAELRQDLPPEPYAGAYDYPHPMLYEHNPVNTFHEYAGAWYAPWAHDGNPASEHPPEDIPVPLEFQ